MYETITSALLSGGALMKESCAVAMSHQYGYSGGFLREDKVKACLLISLDIVCVCALTHLRQAHAALPMKMPIY